MNDLTIKAFRSQKAWESRLARNHESAPGLWVKLAKKASGIPTVTYAETLEVAQSVRTRGILPETRRYVANVLALRGRM